MKKIRFAFLLIVVVFLTGCIPTTTDDDNGNDGDIIDDKKDDGVGDSIPLEGVDPSLILDLDTLLEGTFDGETLVYYFYLSEEITVTIDVEAEFDSVVVIKNITTNETVFEGDDSIYDDDIFTVLTLESGEYMVEVSGFMDGETGAYSVLVSEGMTLERLDLDSSYSATILPGEVDVYYLEVTSKGVYHIVSTSDLDLEGVLLSVEGDFLTYNDDRRFDDEDFELMLDLEVGSYLLGVRPYYEDDEGSYEVLFEEFSVSHSTMLVRETYVSDFLLAGERNSLELTVPSDGWVTLYSDTVFDSVGYLYDEVGNLVEENDDDGGNSDFYMSIFLEAGTYRLDIGSYDDYEGGYYEVYYSFMEESMVDYDTISPGGYVVDSLDSMETDIFQFTLTEQSTLDIYTVSTADMFLEVYNATGTLLDFDDDSGEAYDASISDLVLEPGIYYIHVSEVFSDAVMYYELHMYLGDQGGASENAYDLMLNASIDHVLSPGTSNVYTFTVDSEGVFTAYLMSDFDSVGYLLNELGEMITVNDDASYDNVDFKIDAYPLSPGTYHLYVEGYDTSDGGTYTLINTFEEIETVWYEIEPNGVYAGNLSEGAIDTVSFTLERGGYIRAYLDSGFDSKGSLTDFGGEVLLFNDDYGTDTDFVLEGMYLEPGVYDINISGFTSGEYGSYVLYLEVVYGGNINITSITSSSVTTDTLEEDGYHWYRVDLDEAGYLDVSLDSDFDSYGYIIDEWGRFVAQDDDSGGNGDFLISWYLEMGTYYIVVCGYTALDSGDYTLTLDFTLPVE